MAKIEKSGENLSFQRNLEKSNLNFNHIFFSNNSYVVLPFLPLNLN